MTDRDDLRAAVKAWDQKHDEHLAAGQQASDMSTRTMHAASASVYKKCADDLRALLAEHPAPEPPSDEASMHIDPEPPGVTLRPFIDAEVAALDASIRRATLALLSSEPTSGGEVTADELAEAVASADDCIECEGTGREVAKYDATGEPTEWRTCFRCGRFAAAILARYDVRRRKPAHHGAALRGGDDQ